MSRKGRATFLLFVFSFGLASTLMFGTARPAYAQMTDPITSVQTTLSNVWNVIKEGLVQGAGVAVLNGANYFLQQMAYQLALAILNDCPGQKSCWSSQAWLDNVKQAGEGALGEAIGTLSKESGWEKLGFDLCAPPSLDFQLNIQLGLLDETKPPAPKCDFNKLMKGYSDFANSLSSEQLLSKVKLGFNPGQSGISAGLQARGAILGKKAEATGAAEAKNLTDASAGGGFSGVSDPVSGRVKTPPVGVKDDYERLQRDTKDKAIEANQPVTAGQLSSKAVITVVVNAVSTFAQTLITRLLNKIVKGLLTTEQLVAGQPDIILSREGQLTAPGTSASESSIRSSLSFPSPKTLGSVDPLLDFTVCPTAGRSQQNCVIDAQFANAVRVADAAPLTVRKAIEQGMLHGDWPLISAKDQSRDQDPFCFTFGYCESNLKKLRAVRILPVGWEIAAANSSISQPAHLKDVMERFNDCNAAGELDETHPFCHLIDPDWVLKMPPAQCKAMVYGSSLLDPSIPSRTENCVDQPTCLKQDDDGNCTGGYGYCTRERNVWRFNGDQCPEHYSTCRTLTATKPPEKGQSVPQANLLLNTIEYGACSVDNAGCQPYSMELNPAGTESDITDDWLVAPARYFNRNVQSCEVSDAGCTGLISLGRGEALNLIKNGGFEELEDADADGNTEHPRYWSPFGQVPEGRSGHVSVLNHGTEGVNAVFLDSADNELPQTLATCTLGSTCGTESGCTCGPATTAGFTCRVNLGETMCFYSDAVVQDKLPIRTGKTYTIAASFRNAEVSASTVNGIVTISLVDELGAEIALANGPVDTASADVNRSPLDTCTITGNVIRLAVVGATNPARGSCTFAINKAGVEHGAVRLFAGSGNDVYVDEVQLEEGGGTSFHEGYGATGPQIFAKLPPAGLGCTGDATDREECAGFAGVCRETEVGCELYKPKNSDPAVPGIVGPRDACPTECVGYDAFKREGSEFEKESAVPEFAYFIPNTAKQCTVAEVGCSEFTNLDDEQLSYFTKLRICQRPADNDSQIFYTWEGSDTTGFQLKVWNLKRTGTNNDARTEVLVDESSEAAIADGSASDICADPTSPSCAGGKAGVAPCTKIDASNNTCINPSLTMTEGLCGRRDVDRGDFDCREMYDVDGNRHYRLLSRTIIATDDCHPYRISRTVRTVDETALFQNDCTETNGKWDVARSECVYQASATESRICSASAKDCRSYKGNAATNIRTDFVNDFESGPSPWTGNVEQSPESITVGGHSLKVKAGDFTARRDITEFVFPGRNYEISFWARGSGQLTVSLEDAGPSSPFVCKLSGTSCPSVSGCVCTDPAGRGSCTVPQNDPENDCEISGPLGTNPPAATVAISSNWQQYTVGPIVSTTPLWAKNLIRLSIVASAIPSGPGGIPAAIPVAEYFLDNVILKEVQDNINVVRDSWVTPASCDQTPDGAASPLEMLGCREYTDSKRAVHSLRSFSQLCREKAVGCSAFSSQQETLDNPYEQSFNAVCQLSEICDSAPSCVCNYDTRLRPVAGNTPSILPVTLPDVCRVAVGETECRFDLDRWDDSTSKLVHPDRVNIAADERKYLVVKRENLCDASAAGCKNMGLAHIAFEGQCVYSFPQPDGGDIDGDGIKLTEKVMQPGACDPGHPDQDLEGVCINANARNGAICTLATEDADCGAGAPKCSVLKVDSNTCRCTHPQSGATCELAKGGSGCSLSFEGGISDKWKAQTLKDDPKAYAKNLCLAEAVGCEEYTSNTGTLYFKDPGARLCEFKESVQFNDSVVSGWFRKSESGALVPCYKELLRQGEFFEIYRNQDPACSMPDDNDDGAPDLCLDPGGCVCEKGGQVQCLVPNGERQCGYEGWAGECKPEFDRCEEFIDPASTSPANPNGLPYYYIQNGKMDISSCAGNVSLKQGCVLLKQTSNTVNLYSSTASYLSSNRNSGGDRVPPINCDLPIRNNLCERRCYGVRASVCSQDSSKSCTTDIECGAGNSCLGDSYYGFACETDNDCNKAAGEKCVGPDTAPAIDPVKTRNDSNLIVKVRPDRECAQWLNCINADYIFDEQKGRYERVCTGFGLCDLNNKVGQTFECARYIDEPRKIFTKEKYAARDITYAGLEYSGFSLPGKYPVQFVTPFSITGDKQGVCVQSGNSDGTPCNAKVECGSGYCSTDYLLTRRFGVTRDNKVCRLDSECDFDETGTNPDLSQGKCVEHRCVYDFAGGKLRTTGFPGKLNAPSCRAHPAQDAPYPKEVLDPSADTGDAEQDGYDDYFNPLSKKSAFKGANVCVKGNECECSYERISYGSGGGTVRYHAMQRINVFAGICIGGPKEGAECNPALLPTNSNPLAAHNACGNPEDGGSCRRITSRTISHGWPGFCVDYDLSTNINGSQDRFACNLWLPIDKLAGAPDLFNQFTEAGFEPPEDGSDILYCQAAMGNKNVNGSYLDAWHTDYAGAGLEACTNKDDKLADPSKPCYTANSSTECGAINYSDDAGGGGACVWKDDKFCADKCGTDAFDPVVAACTGASIFTAVFCPFCAAGVALSCFSAESMYNGARFACNDGTGPENFSSTSDAKCEAGGSFVPPSNWFNVSWEDSRKQESGGDNTQIAGYKKDQIVAVEIKFNGNEINVGGVNKPKRMYLYEGNDWINGFTWGGNDDGIKRVTRENGYIITDEGEIVGDGPNADCIDANEPVGESDFENEMEDDCRHAGGANCLGAHLVFGNDGITVERIRTRLCHNASTFGHSIGSTATIYFREACSDLVRVFKNGNLAESMLGSPWTHELKKSFRNVDGAFPYDPGDTGRPGAPITKIVPYGFAVLGSPNAIAQPNNIKVLPVYSTEGGAGSTFLEHPGGNAPYQLAGGTTLAGVPFSCTGNCNGLKPNEGGLALGRGQQRVNEIFAMAWDTYSFRRANWDGEPGTFRYAQNVFSPWDDRSEFTSVGGTSGTDVPKVMTVKSGPPFLNCVSEGICEEGSAQGLTVCLGNNCSDGTTGGDGGNGNIIGTNPKTKVEIRYFAYADRNHMSIRRKILDFGDGSTPSMSTGHFKNHRGTSYVGATNTHTERCTDGNVDWGLDKQACDSRYFQETHTYICNPDLINGTLNTPELPDCSSDGIFPCKSGDVCVFKPRVQILDNWAVCNGRCPGEPGIGDVCIQGSEVVETSRVVGGNPSTNECPSDLYGFTHPYLPNTQTPDPNSPFMQGKRPFTEFGQTIRVPSQ